MSGSGLDRRALVAGLVEDRGDLLVVGGPGSPSWDLAASGDHPLNFTLWGAMGAAAQIGLGLALAQPERPVLVLTGDGEMLMGLGALATVCVHKPANLSIVVLDNQRYGETGMQESHTAHGVDLVGMALAAGFARAERVSDPAELGPLRSAVHAKAGPFFADVMISAEEPPRVLPPRDGVHLKTRFRAALGVGD